MCKGSKSSSHSIKRTRRSYRKGAGKGLSRRVLRFGGFLQHEWWDPDEPGSGQHVGQRSLARGPFVPGTVGAAEDAIPNQGSQPCL